MQCIRSNRKRSSYSESDRRQNEDLNLIANNFYRYNRSRHTIFWRSFDVLRHSFNGSEHKTKKKSLKYTSPDQAIVRDHGIRRSLNIFGESNKCEWRRRRNTYEKCDNTNTYGVRDLTLSTDWVIIDEISNDNNKRRR